MSTPFEAKISGLLEKLQSQVAGFEEAQKSIDSLSGLGTAADGLVSVKAEAGGRPIAIEINPRAMRLGSEMLAEAILEASQKAQKVAD